MRRLIFLVILTLSFQTAYSQSDRRIDWIADLDYLARELPEKHYNFFTVRSKDEFLSGLNAIKSEVGNLTNFQIALRIQRLIASMGDSHTSLNYSQFLDSKQMLPIHLYWFSDGIHILQTTPENKEILGRRILSINKIPIATVIDSLSAIFTVDNPAMVKMHAPELIPSLQILNYFGFADSEQVELELKADAGHNQTCILKPSVMTRNNRVVFKPDSLAFWVKNENAFFDDFYSPDDKIYYMLYYKCWSREIESKYGDREKAKAMPSFKEFESGAFNILKKKPVEKIVFDLRENTGGNSSQGTAFIEKLAEFLKANPKIKIYVITGRKVFSSAILNAMDFKLLTSAVFVGEETAGKPNHFGEVRSFQLPNSKLKVSYSTKYFKRMDDNMNTMVPDVTIESSFSDFKNGIDPVYEWIKNQ